MKENERKWTIMNENERKWKKMNENERKWKKMKEHERKCRKMKEHERTWRECQKMSENERKWKKMKENERKWRQMRKHEEKWRNLDSNAKSSTISMVYRCCCDFFSTILDDFQDFVSECAKENQQPVLRGHRFSDEKWQFSFDVKQKHTFYRRKSTKTKSLRSALISIISLSEHTTTTTHNNNHTQKQPQQQQQQCNLERLRFNRRGASTPLWGVEACSHPSRRPNPIPAIPPYVVRTPHLHGAPTTEETIKLWY